MLLWHLYGFLLKKKKIYNAIHINRITSPQRLFFTCVTVGLRKKYSHSEGATHPTLTIPGMCNQLK